jgi:hypothetical protein
MPKNKSGKKKKTRKNISNSYLSISFYEEKFDRYLSDQKSNKNNSVETLSNKCFCCSTKISDSNTYCDYCNRNYR